MSFQHDEKGYVIIGEAALALALRESNIDVPSLICELTSMAEESVSDERLFAISEARNWLLSQSASENDAECEPYIKTLSSLND